MCIRDRDKNGTPILCAVCEEGFDRLLEKLLDRGADSNARDRAKNNKPAIVLAAEGNHTECIKLLMVSGSDKNAVYDAMGMCALHRYTMYSMFVQSATLSCVCILVHMYIDSCCVWYKNNYIYI